MEVFRHDLFYWQLVHHLVKNEKMRVIEISPDRQEIWLEQEGPKRSIIRLVRKDIDWSNWLKQDVQRAYKRIDFVKKQLGFRTIEAENIYITMYPPVDSWEPIIETPQTGKNKKTVVYSSIIPQDRREEALQPICERLSVTQPTMHQQDIEELQREVIMIAEQRLNQEKELFAYGKTRFTYVLLASIVTMFAMLELNGGSTQMTTLVQFGAKYNPLIEQGEWWRLVSAMFLHIGLLHLFMNSLALYYLGSAVEKIYGSGRFLIIYFIAGIVGSLASYAFSEQIAAGASGAIFGCFGALLFFGVIHRRLFFRTMGMSLIIILAINLSLGFAVPVIDNAAHIGGLLGGFLASSFLHLPKHARHRWQLGGLALSLVTIIALVFFGLHNDQKTGSPLIHLQYAQELLQQDEFEKSYPLLVHVVESEPEMPEAHFLLAYAQAHLGYFEEAEEHLLITLELKPDFHEAYYNLALVYIEFEHYDDALKAVEKALSLSSDEQYSALQQKILEFLDG
ncbi:rhomboid family intramembrane serine protease [Bacillus alkalicellulosilyticus]|uniref:rhomboid family intramembrane serine protease n=1 Tax=Alkalihalobacterium alkalicellulosilyticum TaxID=1912214 RepID=UPI0009974E19|nr:rhomboid family intramembrane serine protease [Bacillus alkalicellulosilyticus]